MVAEADGNRTRQRRGTPLTGFEDQGDHQEPRRLRARLYLRLGADHVPARRGDGAPGQVYDTAIGTTGRQDALTIDVGTLATLDTTVRVGRTTRSGLIASVLQSAQTSAVGGPLVNLNGQVIGIIVGGSGSGLQIIGYAIPINTALAVATQIADGHS